LPQKINNEFRAVNFTTKNPQQRPLLLYPMFSMRREKGATGDAFQCLIYPNASSHATSAYLHPQNALLFIGSCQLRLNNNKTQFAPIKSGYTQLLCLSLQLHGSRFTLHEMSSELIMQRHQVLCAKLPTQMTHLREIFT
jgi:hypothetical protein